MMWFLKSLLNYLMPPAPQKGYLAICRQRGVKGGWTSPKVGKRFIASFCWVLPYE